MTKFIITAMAAMLFSTAVTFAASLEQVAEATYKLYDGNTPICSSVMVTSSNLNDYLVTAAHCVTRKGDFNIRQARYDDDFNITSEVRYNLELKKSLRSRDVAILRVKDETGVFKTVDIAGIEETNNTLKFGSDVFVVGYPKVQDLTFTGGTFSGKVKGILGLDTPLYKATPNIMPGSSGGGLYIKTGKDEYKLIGLTTAMNGDNQFMNFFSTIESLHTVVAGFIEDKAPLPVFKKQIVNEYDEK